MIVLDTNVVSELIKKAPDPKVVTWFESQTGADLFLSALTVAELRSGVLNLPRGKRRDELDAFVSYIIDDEYAELILAFDKHAAEAYALITANLRKQGISVGQNDAMIAAIALVHGAPVATRNAKHFTPCGVEVINPFTPES